MGSKRVFNILVFSFFCKLLLALFMPVYADEAYYFVWSRHPQLSYFDHPPLVSWMIYLGEFLFPIGSALSLRLFFVLASTLTVFIWIKILTRKLVSQKHIEYFVVLLLLNPLLGPGSVVATPDVPLVLFWSLSYLFFIDFLQKKTTLAYSLLGVSLGLGFCSKYPIVVFVLSGLIYLIFSKQYRNLILKKIPLTLFFGFLFSLPVIYWNYKNDWTSFSFQLNHGFGRVNYDVEWTLSYVLGQILILNPFLLPSLLKKSKDRSDQIFGLSQFFFFLTSSFKAVVEANWPITSHLHGTSAATQNLSAATFKRATLYWGFIYAAFVLVALLPQADGLFKNQINSRQLAEVLPIVNQYKPLYGPNYQVSSLLTWMSKENIYKLRGLTRFDFFDSLPESVPTEKEFYVLKHMTTYWPETYQKMSITLMQSFEKPQLELFKVRNE